MGISVTTERNGTLRQQVQVDSFESFVTDAPLEFGGEASAPDAHDHFDLSLGVCKADDCDHYARRKELPLQGVTAHVLRDDSKERQGIYRLDVTLTFHGIEDEASAKRLHEITDRCPIRLMAASQVEITSHVDLA
ncbi:OsmC family protein [Modicisalibacter luteus]|uniref:OsmC family protein n=1 Tax=Modicisalibacter luteus TaxID=453962 RepID=UPI0036423A9F